jgi:PadR family transcriptional regulator PadR
MSNRDEKERIALLQGTLDLLILRILVFGPEHGQGIALAIQRNSDEVLLVDHGALYPALQRLETQKWISAEWGVSSNNRRARFYTLTAKGRDHLTKETSKWRKVATAMARILDLEKLAPKES